MSRFKDQIIFISGGTSGIGLATAAQFAAAGAAQVIVCGRRESKWQQAQIYLEKKLTKAQHHLIQYWPCDVRVENQLQKLIEKIFKEFGRLDVCFNNAGVQPGVISEENSGSIADMQLESATNADGSIIYRIPLHTNHPTQTTAASPFCESEIATSCIGMLYSLKWQVHYIFEQQPKELPVSIINTASRNGVLPDSRRPLYAASKAFILALTKSVANQVAQRSLKEKRETVRVNAISPGPIDTPLEFAAYGTDANDKTQYANYVKNAAVGVPMKRTGQPEEIAPTVLFLADHSVASYITGSNICVDGGHTGSPLLCACD